MNEYVEILKYHVAENPPNYGNDANSILEIEITKKIIYDMQNSARMTIV